MSTSWKATNHAIELSQLRPFTIQGFCLRAVNRLLADGRTRMTTADIEAIKDSVLAEVASMISRFRHAQPSIRRRGERAGTLLPASFNEALAVIADLKGEVARLRGEKA